MSQQPYVPAAYIPGQDLSGQQSHGAQQQPQSGGVFVPGGQPPPPQQVYGQQQQYHQQQPGAAFVPGQQHQQQTLPPQQHMNMNGQQQQQLQAYVPGQQHLGAQAGERGGGTPYAAMGVAAVGTAAVVGASYVAYQHYNANDTSYQSEFQKLDLDNSGHLEKNELERMFGKWMPKQIIDAAMKMADKDKDGKVSLDEYVAIRQHLVKLGFAAAGLAAVAGAGYVAYQHHNNNDDVADPQSQQSQHQHHSEGGMPSYATMGAAAAGTAVVGGAGYMAYQHHHNSQRPQQPGEQRTGQSHATQQQGNVVASPYEKEFERLDADGSGHLEERELEKLFGKWIPKSIIDAAMKAVDADKDGKVSMQEYVAIRQSLGGTIPGL